MKDHSVFELNGLVDLIIAEVKAGRCALNGPWTDPNSQNMHRVLYAVGAFPPDKVDQVADSLYSKQYYEDGRYRLRLFALGREANRDLATPPVVQLTWDEILRFVYDRLYAYRHEKSQHYQWDRSGRLLYQKMQQCRTSEQFVEKVMQILRS